MPVTPIKRHVDALPPVFAAVGSPVRFPSFPLYRQISYSGDHTHLVFTRRVTKLGDNLNPNMSL